MSVSVVRGVTIDGTSLQQYAPGAIRSAAAFLPLAGHAHRTCRRARDLVLARASTFLENMPHPGCRVFVLNVRSRGLALLGGPPPRRREPSRARRPCGCAPGSCSPRPGSRPLTRPSCRRRRTRNDWLNGPDCVTSRGTSASVVSGLPDRWCSKYPAACTSCTVPAWDLHDAASDWPCAWCAAAAVGGDSDARPACSSVTKHEANLAARCPVDRADPAWPR